MSAQVADSVEQLRETSAEIFTGWIDGGSAYFVARGLDEAFAREITLALVGGLEGAFLLARPLRSAEPLVAAGRALAPQYRGGRAGAAGRCGRRSSGGAVSVSLPAIVGAGR